MSDVGGMDHQAAAMVRRRCGACVPDPARVKPANPSFRWFTLWIDHPGGLDRALRRAPWRGGSSAVAFAPMVPFARGSVQSRIGPPDHQLQCSRIWEAKGQAHSASCLRAQPADTPGRGFSRGWSPVATGEPPPVEPRDDATLPVPRNGQIEPPAQRGNRKVSIPDRLTNVAPRVVWSRPQPRTRVPCRCIQTWRPRLAWAEVTKRYGSPSPPNAGQLS